MIKLRFSKALPKTLLWAAVLWSAALFLALAPSAPAQDKGFKLVAHADNPTVSLDKSTVSKMFMRKKSKWPDWDDAAVVPIDQPLEAEVRSLLSLQVHEKSVSAVNSYWQRMIFSGRTVPPDIQPDDRAVLEYIKNNPGAVSYVSPTTELPDDIKELEIIYE